MLLEVLASLNLRIVLRLSTMPFSEANWTILMILLALVVSAWGFEE